jgi:aminoglycoside phosphotransferase (APT) family kinase protein
MTNLPAGVSLWIASLIGSDVVTAAEITGGASRSSFVVTDARGEKYFLRMDMGKGPLSGTQYSLAREYSVLEFLQDTDVPVARIHGYSAEHDAILMEFLPGYTSYQRTCPPDEETALQRDLVASIVRLQALDPSGLSALGASGAPLGEAIRQDLAGWADLYRQNVNPRDPLLDFALNWLGSEIPDAGRQPVIVHGDIGPGNFLIDDGKVRALIDWEMVRIGHPLEDLACIIARGLGAPFGTARDHIDCYEELTGVPVDLRAFDYALALVITRWTIAISMALSRPSAAQNVPMLFAFRQINERALVDAFCRYYGLPEADGTCALSENPAIHAATVYCREALDQLAKSETLDGGDRYKLQGISDLVAYLKSFIEYGPETYASEETRRIAALVPPGDDPRRAICDFVEQVPLAQAKPVVEYLRWRTGREHGIMRASLNVRADNVIAY